MLSERSELYAQFRIVALPQQEVRIEASIRSIKIFTHKGKQTSKQTATAPHSLD